jgi:RNA polymerase sigma factor (sigma-70 family)
MMDITEHIKQAQERELILARPMSSLTDADRLTVRKGDRAIAALLKKFDRYLWANLNQFFGVNAAEYYYVALDGFYKAVKSFDGRGEFLGWLSKKVRWELQSAIRSNCRTAEHSTTVDPVVFETISVECDRVDEPTEVLAAISKLDADEQQVVNLYTQGFSWSEIGEVIQRSSDAAAAWFQRILKKVRRILGVDVVSVSRAKRPSVSWMRRTVDRFTSNKKDYPNVTQHFSRKQQTIPQQFNAWVARQKPSDWVAYALTSGVLATHVMTPSGWLAIPLYGATAAAIVTINKHRRKTPKAVYKIALGAIVLAFAWSVLGLFQPADALFFDTLAKGIKALLDVFNIPGLDPVSDYISKGLALIGVVFVASKIIGYLKSRQGDDEEQSRNIQNLINVILALTIGDVLISFFFFT